MTSKLRFSSAFRFALTFLMTLGSGDVFFKMVN